MTGELLSGLKYVLRFFYNNFNLNLSLSLCFILFDFCLCKFKLDVSSQEISWEVREAVSFK